MISQGLMVSPKHNSPQHVERWIMLNLLVDVRRRYLRIGVCVVWNGLGGKFLREGFGSVGKIGDDRREGIDRWDNRG
jgi:hypothetical protein